jgi:glycolate oxidase FAD binding subunit
MGMSPEIVTESFAEVVGADRVRAGGDRDAIRGVVPHLVIQPATDDDVAAVLRIADQHDLAVAPVGGGSKLGWGRRPARVDVVLSTRRLNRVIEHAWSDLTVSVEAGCTVGALQERLQAHGQRVAIDPLWPDRATVGGVLSTNDTGTLRLRFGGLRDLIIGVTLALADGTLARSGGKVVKNVAGYDLPKLATGAFGTLGVITSAIFRVHPLPQETATFTMTVPDAHAMQRTLEALQDSKLAHSSLQARGSSTGEHAIDIRFDGNGAGIAAQRQMANQLSGGPDFEEAPASVWNVREDLWSSNQSDPIVKLSVLPSSVGDTLEVIGGLARNHRFCWDAVFQATGIGWIRFQADHSPWAAVVPELRSAVERGDGSLVVFRSADSCDVWGDAGDAVRIMKAVKDQFDPKATLNPGRFVGGI